MRPRETASSIVAFCTWLLFFLSLPGIAGEADDLFQQGLRLQNAGQMDQAVPFYLKAVEENPRHFRSLSSLCHILITKGEPDRAYPFCSDAITLDPKNAALHNNLGILYTLKNRVDLAIESFKKSIEFAPDYITPRENLGFLYSRLGVVDLAIQQYEKLIELGPKNPSYRIFLAKLYAAKGNKNKALELMRETVARFPKSSEASLFMADLLLSMGDPKEALKIYDQLLSSIPENSDLHFGRGRALFQLKRWKKAHFEFTLTLNKAPNHLEARQFQLQAEQRLFEHNKRIILVIIGILAVLAVIITPFVLKSRKKQIVSEANLPREFAAKLKEIRDPEATMGFILDYLSEYLEFPHSVAFVPDYPRKRLVPSIQNLPARLQSDFSLAQEEISRMIATKGCRMFTAAQMSREMIYQIAFPTMRDRTKERPIQLFIPLAERMGRSGGKLLALLAMGSPNPKKARHIIEQIKKRKMPVLTELMERSTDALEDLNLYLLSVQDELTRVYNKRAFLDRLKEELKKVEKYHQPCSLLMMDIDHFKKMNDTYGHPQGDIVLREVAKEVKLSLREGIDTVARYGGEEFVVILPATPENVALSTAERIRERVAGLGSCSDEIPTQVTVSIGAATYPTHARSDTQLVKLADIALYYSKRNGRNRATLISHIPETERITSEDSPVKRDTSTDSLGRILPALAQAWDRIQGEIGKANRDKSTISFVAVAPQDEAQQNPPILLQAFKVIQENIRLIDFVVQHKGRYLIVVLPEFGGADVVEPARELVAVLGETPMGLNKDTRLFCAGIAVYPEISENPDMIIEGCLKAFQVAQKTEDRVFLCTQSMILTKEHVSEERS